MKQDANWQGNTIYESNIVPQVSRYWNILALDGSNWQKINLFEFQRDIEVIFFDKQQLIENVECIISIDT